MSVDNLQQQGQTPLLIGAAVIGVAALGTGGVLLARNSKKTPADTSKTGAPQPAGATDRISTPAAAPEPATAKLKAGGTGAAAAPKGQPATVPSIIARSPLSARTKTTTDTESPNAVPLNPEISGQAHFAGEQAMYSDLRDIRDLAPDQRCGMLTAALATTSLGSGKDAHAFTIPGYDALVLRVTHDAAKLDAGAARPANLVPVRFNGELHKLGSSELLGVPRAVMVTDEHAFAQRESITPEEALAKDNGVKYWLLNKCEGSRPASSLNDTLRSLLIAPSKYVQDLAVLRENNLNLNTASEKSNARAAAIEKIFGVGGSGTALTEKEQRIQTEIDAKKTAVNEKRGDIHYEKESYLSLADRFTEKTKNAFYAFKVGSGQFSPTTQEDLDDQVDELRHAQRIVTESRDGAYVSEYANASKEIQQVFHQNYQAFLNKYTDFTRELAELPQDAYDSAAQAIRTVHDLPESVNLDMEHGGNTVRGQNRIQFVDLDFSGKRTRGSLEELHSVLMGKDGRVPWKFVVHEGDRAQLRPHLQQVIDKLSAAGVKHGVTWLPEDENGAQFTQFRRHFDLHVPVK